MILKAKNASLDFFREKCREHSLKVTPQRTLIYKELLKSKDHPNADVLFSRVNKIFPDISLDTVNRTLLTFHNIGIVNIVEGYGDPRRFDPDIENHHHFRCVKCNSITDFDYNLYDNLKVPEEIQKKFFVLNKKVLLEGYCDKCRKKI
jgi:Fur family peroxide stress response transcriptional regulator